MLLIIYCRLSPAIADGFKIARYSVLYGSHISISTIGILLALVRLSKFTVLSTKSLKLSYIWCTAHHNASNFYSLILPLPIITDGALSKWMMLQQRCLFIIKRYAAACYGEIFRGGIIQSISVVRTEGAKGSWFYLYSKRCVRSSYHKCFKRVLPPCK